MFDTPDLGPVCVAPCVGLAIAALAYSASAFMMRRSRTGKSILPVLAALVMAPVAACLSLTLRIGELDPTPWSMPRQEDVVGTWHLDARFAGILQDEGYPVPPHSIVFTAEGTFEMHDVPNLWITLSEATSGDPTEFNATGTWRIDPANARDGNDRRFAVLLRYESISLVGLDLSQTPVYVNGEIPFFFRGHLRPYRLDAIGYGTYNPFMRFVRE